VIFYETASAPQLLSGEYMIFVEAIAALQQRGYEVLILTNFGTSYVFAGRSPIVVRSAFDGLSIGYRINRATCHYFDILAVRQDLDTAAIRSVMPFLS
jgi:hypothetical protein